MKLRWLRELPPEIWSVIFSLLEEKDVRNLRLADRSGRDLVDSCWRPYAHVTEPLLIFIDKAADKRVKHVLRQGIKENLLVGDFAVGFRATNYLMNLKCYRPAYKFKRLQIDVELAPCSTPVGCFLDSAYPKLLELSVKNVSDDESLRKILRELKSSVGTLYRLQVDFRYESECNDVAAVVSQLPALKALELKHFRIRGEDMPKLTQLTRLHVDSDDLIFNDLAALSHLTRLEDLVLRHQRILGDPVQLCALTSLKRLKLTDLWDRATRTLKCVAAFPNLEELALVGFNLDNVDMSLLTKLRMLDLQEVALDNINFNGLSSLTQLELSYVKVANRFPESIGALVSLRELVMARLEMRKKGVALPNSIGNLTSLSRLAFFSCTHGDMPDSISGLVSLRNLHICVDGLARLPETFERLQSLTHLHISAAEIQLPNSLSKLTQLKSFQLHLYPVHLAFLVDPPPGDMEAMAALLAPIPQLRSLGALRLDLPGPVTIPADITNLDRLTRLEYKSPLGASKAPSVFFELITLRCLEIVTSEPDLQPPTHEIFKLRKLRKLTIPHQWKGTMKLKRGLPLLTKIEYVYHKFHTWL